MPIYSYLCRRCSCNFEKFYSFKDYIESPPCDSCKSKKTERRYIEDVGTLISTVRKSDSELKTIGDLANRNRDSLSSDRKQELEQKHNAYKDTVSHKELPTGMSRIKKTLKTRWT